MEDPQQPDPLPSEGSDVFFEIDSKINLAWLLRNRDTQQAFDLSQEAYELSTWSGFSAEPYLKGQIRSLRNLAYFNADLGNLGLAFQQNNQGLALLEMYPDPVIKIDFLQQLAWVFYCLGNFASALELIQSAQNISASIGDQSREAEALNTMAIILLDTGDRAAARSNFQQSLLIFREIGNLEKTATVLNNLAMFWKDEGQFGQALNTGLESLSMAQQANYAVIVLHALDTLGQVYLAQRDFERALSFFQQALDLARGKTLRMVELEAQLNMAKTEFELGRLDEALLYARQALVISEGLQANRWCAHAHELIAKIFERKIEFDNALQHFKLFHRYNELVFSLESEKRLNTLKIVYEVESARKAVENIRNKNLQLEREIEERQQLSAQLEKLASTDPLTGLYNRRYFYNVAEQLFSQTSRQSDNLSIILIDVDKFKNINDQYGHARGDEYLVAMAHRLQTLFRRTDVICRYGGDEFLILLPGASQEQACRLAEQTREQIISHPLLPGPHEPPLTISTGVAGYNKNIASLEELIRKADEALYKAKAKGRNMVVPAPIGKIRVDYRSPERV